jgi:hypothetical protein
MDEGSAESHRSAENDQSAEARSVTPVFQEIVQHSDDNLVNSCELAYSDSLFLTHFKDVIARAGRANSREIRNLLRKVLAVS